MLVKENTTEATGIISRRVATVPNLSGRVQSVRCNEGRTCSKEVHGVRKFWWASGLLSRACPPRFTTLTRNQYSAGKGPLTQYKVPYVPRATLTSWTLATPSAGSTRTTSKLLPRNTHKLDPPCHERRCHEIALSAVSYTFLPRAIRILTSQKNEGDGTHDCVIKVSIVTRYARSGASEGVPGIKFNGRYITYRTSSLTLKRAKGFLSAFPSLWMESPRAFSSRPSATTPEACLAIKVPSKVSIMASCSR